MEEIKGKTNKKYLKIYKVINFIYIFSSTLIPVIYFQRKEGRILFTRGQPHENFPDRKIPVALLPGFFFCLV